MSWAASTDCQPTAPAGALLIEFFTGMGMDFAVGMIDTAIREALAREGETARFVLNCAMVNALKHAPVPMAVDTNALYRQMAIAYSGVSASDTFASNSN